MFDAAGLLPLQPSKWQVHRKHREAARMAAFRSLVHFIRHYDRANRRAPEDVWEEGGGRLADSWYRCIGGIQQQLCQYSRLPKVLRKGLDPYRFGHDRIKWELRMIFSDSVTQQFSDPHSIGFKVPLSWVWKAYPPDKGHSFSPARFRFPFFFFAAFSRSSPAAFSPAFPSSLLCTSAEVWVFTSPTAPPTPPPQRLAWPKALIAKLVYIGEINALQMRLNTYSKKCRQCVSGLSPKSGGWGGEGREKKEHLCSTKLESQSEACRYSPSHPLLWRKRGGFSICMLVCNSWHYITCRQQSNSCGIVKVLFHMGEQSVEFHSWRQDLLTTWMQSGLDRCRDHSKILLKKTQTKSEDHFKWRWEHGWSLSLNFMHSLWSN